MLTTMRSVRITLVGLGFCVLPAFSGSSVAHAQAPSSSDPVAAFAAAPKWDRGLLRPDRGCRFCDLDDQTRSDILGFGNLGSAEVEAAATSSFAKSGNAGRTRHYRAGSTTGSSRPVDGYLSFAALSDLPPLTAATTSSIPNEAQVLARAKDLAAQLGLLDEEVVGIETHGIAIGGRTLLGPVEPVTIGRTVELKRAVAGYRVLGSSVRFEFGKDLKLQKTLIHWPPFRLRPGLTKMRDRSVVLGEIAEKAGGQRLHHMEIVYAQGEDGFMAPAMLVVAGSTGNGNSGSGNNVRLGTPEQKVVLLAE